ncbi:hypothetical protein [Sphingomonas sp. LT1P40]|uniref:hypothetical protein n=1 Tax=Alteristakelama amylovorans TaxID=3096166 RepID=UPI002FC68FC3
MSKRALVVGGAGPTGPLVVNGLLARGFSVSVLSTGRHPAVFDGTVQRIVADPHFAEPLEAALAGRTFDVTLAQYGRLRVVAAALAGRTGQFVAVSTRAYPGWLDPASMHRPDGAAMSLRDLPLRYHDDAMPVDEATPLEAVGKFGRGSWRRMRRCASIMRAATLRRRSCAIPAFTERDRALRRSGASSGG